MNVINMKKTKKGEPQDPLYPTPDLKMVRLLSAARMSDKHMSLMLDITIEAFKWLLHNDQKFQDAMEKGRAEAIFNCAQIVLRATQGQLGRKVVTTDSDGNRTETYGDMGDNEREQLKSAQLYLHLHAPGWMSDKS